jgi:hypothetical protein
MADVQWKCDSRDKDMDQPTRDVLLYLLTEPDKTFSFKNILKAVFGTDDFWGPEAGGLSSALVYLKNTQRVTINSTVGNQVLSAKAVVEHDPVYTSRQAKILRFLQKDRQGVRTGATEICVAIALNPCSPDGDLGNLFDRQIIGRDLNSSPAEYWATQA